MNVESHELDSYTPVPDELVLAAVRRAQRHHNRVPRRLISIHLGFKHSAATTRRLRPQLEALRADGSLKTERRNGQEIWALTRRGSGRLAAARRAGKVGALPESPQHRIWRHAREEAGKRFCEIRRAAKEAAAEASLVIEPTVPKAAGSTQMLELSERLRWEFWRLGVATYCLHEWPEPDDARRDEDDEQTPGPFSRRSVDFLGRKGFDDIGGRP
jgi:hypothetical protein